MLFLIMGASGSGKSACLPGLRQRRPEIDWRDFDDVPLPLATTADRQRATEFWLTLAAKNEGRETDTGVAGTVVLGEALACRNAPRLAQIHALLLDCSDVVRIDRIRRRDGIDSPFATQEMLCWAAWLRMHAVDPQWRQDVIAGPGASGMNWQRWSSWARFDDRWIVPVLDNSVLSIEETTEALLQWVERLSPTPAP